MTVIVYNCHISSSPAPPQFAPAAANATLTKGKQFTFPYQLSGKPPPNITLTKDSVPVTDTRFTVTTTSLTIADVTCDDSGEYQVTASNVAGSDTFTLTVDVYCECVCVCVCVCVCNVAGSDTSTLTVDVYCVVCVCVRACVRACVRECV